MLILTPFPTNINNCDTKGKSTVIRLKVLFEKILLVDMEL